VGPDHDKTFTATVCVGDISGVGVGRSKKAAEQIAADIAARLLEQA
jgi:ribonuclease-3